MCVHVSVARVEGLGVSSGSDTLIVPDCNAHELSARQLHWELRLSLCPPQGCVAVFSLSFSFSLFPSLCWFSILLDDRIILTKLHGKFVFILSILY